jgi:hypothetical protein
MYRGSVWSRGCGGTIPGWTYRILATHPVELAPVLKVGDWVKVVRVGDLQGEIRHIKNAHMINNGTFELTGHYSIGWIAEDFNALTPEEASTYLRDVILKGRKPHRDDFTLADLKPGMRPGLPKEEFRPLEYEVFQDGRWQSLEYAGWIPHSLSPKIRTTRLLPPLTKTVELTADDVRRAFNQVNQSLKSLENILIEGCARDKMVS